MLWALAREKAIKAIKVQLRAQSVRLSYIPSRDIRAFADAYFADHRRELIEEAKAIVSKRKPELLKLYKRECAQFKQSAPNRAFSPNRTKSTGVQIDLLVPNRCQLRTLARSGLQAI